VAAVASYPAGRCAGAGGWRAAGRQVLTRRLLPLISPWGQTPAGGPHARVGVVGAAAPQPERGSVGAGWRLAATRRVLVWRWRPSLNPRGVAVGPGRRRAAGRSVLAVRLRPPLIPLEWTPAGGLNARVRLRAAAAAEAADSVFLCGTATSGRPAGVGVAAAAAASLAGRGC